MSLNGSQTVSPEVQRIVLTGPDPYGTNTYDNPNMVSISPQLECTTHIS